MKRVVDVSIPMSKTQALFTRILAGATAQTAIERIAYLQSLALDELSGHGFETSARNNDSTSLAFIVEMAKAAQEFVADHEATLPVGAECAADLLLSLARLKNAMAAGGEHQQAAVFIASEFVGFAHMQLIEARSGMLDKAARDEIAKEVDAERRAWGLPCSSAAAWLRDAEPNPIERARRELGPGHHDISEIADILSRVWSAYEPVRPISCESMRQTMNRECPGGHRR